MDVFRQTKSGMWHLVYINRTNCSRYKDVNWKNDKVVAREDLPPTAKICKSCFVKNQ